MADEQDHRLPSQDPASPRERRGRRDFLKKTLVTAAGVALVGCGSDTDPAVTMDRDPVLPDDVMPGMDGGAPMPVDDAGVTTPEPSPPEPPEATPQANAFDLGIASGDVTDDSAVLWTRYYNEAGTPLRLSVWQMAGEAYDTLVYEADVVTADAGFLHHTAVGLVPGARHRFAFFEMDGERRAVRSPIGTFRCAPAADSLAPVSFGAVACTNQGFDQRTLSRAGERDDLDLFLLLGDTSYNDTASTSMESFRDKWAENLGNPHYRALRASTSVLATWDDHEVANDFNPETTDKERIRIARQALFENLPLARSSEDDDRIWKKRSWGKTADFFVLDCRGERLPSTRGTDDAIYISRAQMDWLKDELLRSSARFKIIMNSVPISDFPGLFDLAGADRWEGYPAQREEILGHIEDNAIDGVLWVAGDFHLASVQRVGARNGDVGWSQREVLVGPGGQLPNPALIAGGFGFPKSQFDWVSGENNFTKIALDPSSGVARIDHINGDGLVINTADLAIATPLV